MKSIVLLVWLITTGGKEQSLQTRYFDSDAACEAAAHAIVEQYRKLDQPVRTLCHAVVEEIPGDDLDELGSPIRR